MSMKKSDLDKHQGKKVTGAMKREVTPERFGANAGAHGHKRDQRDRERAAGLVPFAVKLPHALVASLQALAKKRGVTLNEIATELLQHGVKE